MSEKKMPDIDKVVSQVEYQKGWDKKENIDWEYWAYYWEASSETYFDMWKEKIVKGYIRADRIEEVIQKHLSNTNTSALFNDLRDLVRGENELLEDKPDE